MSQFLCTRLKEALVDEAKAGPDYRQLVKDLQAEDSGILATQEEKEIMKISFDEDRHYDILEKIYERRCKPQV